MKIKTEDYNNIITISVNDQTLRLTRAELKDVLELLIKAGVIEEMLEEIEKDDD